MTIERALELLPQMRDSEWITALGQKAALYTNEAKEAFNLAISALEKQIPKKPVWKEIDITNDGVPCKNAFCPVCEAEYEPDDIDRIGFDYCYSCGQALNWGDDHDRVL